MKGTLKYALVQSTGEVLTPACLPESIRVLSARPASAEPKREALDACRRVGSLPRAEEEIEAFDVGRCVSDLLRAGESEIYRKVFLAVDRIVLDVVLGHVKGNQAQASELLGISRTTLRAKLRSLGMAIEKQLLLETDQDDH